jgi:hypothetical protein
MNLKKHDAAAPGARTAFPVVSPRQPREPAADYVERIRRHVCGVSANALSGTAFDPVPTGLNAAQCRRRLDSAAVEFGGWLARAGTTISELVPVPPAQVAAAINHMHRGTHRLTMSNDAVLDNIVTLAREVTEQQVPGDFIEAGAWRGGVAMLMRALLSAYDDEPSRRVVWVADSFAGLPRPDPGTDLVDAIWHHLLQEIDGLQVDQASVELAFAEAGLLDDQVRFLAGWFEDTLPGAPIEQLALARLDGDWYESTLTALEALYPRLSPGGALIVDDYGLPTGCARAVDRYRATHGIDEPLQRVDHQAVFWRKRR